ncbi:MAG: DUF4097 family beta strand repeat-containing protein [Xanthomonadales bacterium]|jgi:hypothetical protein|nr:DUF4097 family beta strand repeat-containing protein [Xanthomonadales bacterium]
MKKTLVLCALLVSPALQAGSCEYSKEIEQNLDLSGSKHLAINALAGDLEVRGVDGKAAVIRGTVCVSEEEWLEESGVKTSGGDHAEVTVELPNASGWSWTGNRYAYIDLEVGVPEGMPVKVSDSSGDAEFSGLAALSVKDSSGDLDIRNIGGAVVIEDSSGDINVRGVKGDVTVPRDSSGDMEIEDVTGDVLVERDSSGGMYFGEVGGSVMVERDSSGDIEADGVGGDFTVMRDGSGSIRARNVTGTVSEPD